MSRNALALFDTDSRNQVFQFIKIVLDRKAHKNEMVSPYDDQLIGKMNFTMGIDEKSMFFTYAKASEYGGKKFKHHKVVYASMDTSDSSVEALKKICSQFGGYYLSDDERDTEWIKVDAEPIVEEELLNVVEEEEIRPEREEDYDRYEEYYPERESFTVAKEDLLPNRGKTENRKENGDGDDKAREEKKREENRQNRSSENGENGKKDSQGNKENENRSQKSRNHYKNKNRQNSGEQNREAKPQPENRVENTQGNVNSGEKSEQNKEGGSNHHRRRRPHHHRSHKPRTEGEQAPKQEG